MELLPNEILTKILYEAYGSCLGNNKQLVVYVNGALVCTLWRDILYSHKSYSAISNAINTITSLPWDERYVSVISIIKAHLLSGRTELQSHGYNVNYSVGQLDTTKRKTIELAISGKNNSIIRITHIITSMFETNKQHDADVIDDMNNIVNILRG